MRGSGKDTDLPWDGRNFQKGKLETGAKEHLMFLMQKEEWTRRLSHTGEERRESPATDLPLGTAWPVIWLRPEDLRALLRAMGTFTPRHTHLYALGSDSPKWVLQLLPAPRQ